MFSAEEVLKIKKFAIKQAIVIRSDLKMGKGKLVAQGAHASLAAYKVVRERYPEIAKKWEEGGQKKVVLRVNSERELFEYYQAAKDAGMPVELIRDAGLTQIESGSPTCFAIGPWKEEEIDKVVGQLKLL